MQPQSIRIAVSKIHMKNPGITMNAAAQLFAEKKHFSIQNLLSSEDKASLQNATRQAVPRPSKVAKQIRAQKRHAIEPDFQSPYVGEANANVDPYVRVYLLENGLRRVILDVYGPKDVTWWADPKRVPDTVRQYSERIQNAEKQYQWLKARGDHPIYYVGLGELFKIIENNWEPFKPVFHHLEQLRAWVNESVPIRNLVAHNVATRKEERQNIVIRTDYIGRLIEKWYGKRP